MKMEEPPFTIGQIPKSVFSNRTDFSANKSAIPKLLDALRIWAHSKSTLIPFPKVSHVFSWWRIRKQERDEIMYDLPQEGFLKIIPFHGMILEEGQP